MRTYPLESITLQEAKRMQFRLVDIAAGEFNGKDILSLGDIGLTEGINKPRTTLRVERVIAKFFNSEAGVLVRGSGTGAIRLGLCSMIMPGGNLLVNDAPVYPTTEFTAKSMGLNLIKGDFNNERAIIRVLDENKIHGALIQYTRQKIEDNYDIGRVIEFIRRREIPILTDDNYAVMKVGKIGVELGADISAFSLFKLLGPEGVGCVVGRKKYVDEIIKSSYSGGSQVQGHEALEALRGLIYAPVSLAIQSEVNEEIAERLNRGEVKGVKKALIANAQSKVVLVEFERPIAKEVLIMAERLGAAPNPVGAESKYEFVPMFYRISGTFRASDCTLEDRMIRINPMRSGADTVIRILKESLGGLI